MWYPETVRNILERKEVEETDEEMMGNGKKHPTIIVLPTSKLALSCPIPSYMDDLAFETSSSIALALSHFVPRG